MVVEMRQPSEEAKNRPPRTARLYGSAVVFISAFSSSNPPLEPVMMALADR